MKSYRSLVLISLMILSGLQLWSQEGSDLKSGDYQDMAISSIIDQLSDLYDVSLYYKPDNQLTLSLIHI